MLYANECSSTPRREKEEVSVGNVRSGVRSVFFEPFSFVEVVCICPCDMFVCNAEALVFAHLFKSLGNPARWLIVINQPTNQPPLFDLLRVSLCVCWFVCRVACCCQSVAVSVIMLDDGMLYSSLGSARLGSSRLVSTRLVSSRSSRLVRLVSFVSSRLVSSRLVVSSRPVSSRAAHVRLSLGCPLSSLPVTTKRVP